MEASTSSRSSHDCNEPAPSVREFLAICWRTGVINLLPMLFAYIAGFGLILPFIPTVMRDFFASRAAGHAIHCEDYAALDKPHACIDGSDAVVHWSSYTSFLSNTVLLFCLSPLTGLWSDIVGRKPFLLAGQLLSLLPKLVLLLHFTTGLSLWYYYPVDVVNGAVSPLVATLAYVADALPGCYRAAGFGLILAVFAAGIAATPKLGALLSFRMAVQLGVGLKLGGLLYTVLCIRESVKPEAAERARQSLAAKAAEAQGPLWPEVAPDDEARVGRVRMRAWALSIASSRLAMRVPALRYMVKGLSIVCRNAEFMKLTAALMCSSLIQNGLGDIDSQYFVTLFNFTKADFANLFVIFGVGTLLVQLFVMQPMLSVLGEKATLVIAFAAGILKPAGLAAAQSKLQCYLALCVGTVGVMSFPAVSSIKANAVLDHEQGAVQGALSGAQALAQGFGPLVFMQLYHFCTQIVFMPRFVPAVAAAVSVVPLLLIAFLDLPKLERWKVTSGFCSPRAARLDVEEPLLPEGHWVVGGDGAARLCGRDVFLEEGGVAHKDADVTQGLFLEGEALHGVAARQQARPPTSSGGARRS